MAESNRPRRRSKKSRKQPLQPPHSHLDGAADSTSGSADGTGVKPHYNEDGREWTFLGRLVKRFRQSAHVQEAVLKEFQRLGWRKCIDNPLPRRAGKNPKQDLWDVIRNLNRHQHFRGMEFFDDGTGRHIGWRPRTRVRRATQKLPRGSS